jgi:hypothetical protein
MTKQDHKRLIIDRNYSIKLIRERRRIVGYVGQRRVPESKIALTIRLPSGWHMPAIYHPTRVAEYTRVRRFPRKVKATRSEALAYARRAIEGRK